MRCPRLDTLVALADALDVDPAELVLGLRPARLKGEHQKLVRTTLIKK